MELVVVSLIISVSIIIMIVDSFCFSYPPNKEVDDVCTERDYGK